MTINHDHLREMAEKATPIYTDLLGDRYFNDDYSHATLNVQQDDFIRAFSPETAIALLDELAALRKENEGLRACLCDVTECLDQHGGAYCDLRDKGDDDHYIGEARKLLAARAAIGDSHE